MNDTHPITTSNRSNNDVATPVSNNTKQAPEGCQQQQQSLETPLLYFVIEPLLSYTWIQNLWNKYYSLRNDYVVVPHIQIQLLALPLYALFLAGVFSTFIAPSLKNSGVAASFAIVLTFLTANKTNSLFTFFLGISYEQLICYHNLSACLSFVLGIFHAYVVYAFGPDKNKDDKHASVYAGYGTQPNVLQFLWDGTKYQSGTLIVALILGLILTSTFRILLRKHLYEIWLFLHITCVCGLLVFCFIHCFMILLVPTVGWWLFDLFVRYCFMPFYKYNHTLLATKQKQQPNGKRSVPIQIQTLSSSSSTSTMDIIQIRFPKQQSLQDEEEEDEVIGSSTSATLWNTWFKRGIVNYNSGQFIKIMIPQISPFEYHPFTISSSPYEKDVTLHIRVAGKNGGTHANQKTKHTKRFTTTTPWTQKLAHLSHRIQTHTNQETTTPNPPIMFLEGPYGNLSALDIWNTPTKKYSTIVLVCGGIGITPCMSIIKSLLYEYKHKLNNQHLQLQSIKCIWSIRDIEWSRNVFPPHSFVISNSATTTTTTTTTITNPALESVVSYDPPYTDIEVTSSSPIHDNSTHSPSSSNEEPSPTTTTTNPAAPILQTDMYVTDTSYIPTKNHDTTLIMDNDDDDHTTTTSMEFKYHKGRPNYDTLFQQFKEQMIDPNNSSTTNQDTPSQTNPEEEQAIVHHHHVAVISCGPMSLLDQVRKACRKHSHDFCSSGTTTSTSPTIQFDLHEEVFEF